jgi:predicted metalloenzyme YecM
VFPQGVQNLLNMLQVFLTRLVVNHNVIQIHHYKIIGEWSQDIVHHPHESGWSIFQAKGHDQPFKNTFL